MGSTNDVEGARRSGVARDLNRGRFGSVAAFAAALDGDGFGSVVWAGLARMLGWRRCRGCFHPDSAQRVWPGEGPVLVVEREGRGARALVVTNLGGSPASVEIGRGWCSMDGGDEAAPVLEIGRWESRWFDGEPAARVSAG